MHKQHVLILNVLLVHVRIRNHFSFYLEKIFHEFLVPGQPNTGGGGDTGMMNMYLMLGIWLAIAFLLFMFRPRTLRNNRDHLGKSNNPVD
jgi:hypothetical protein